MPFTFAVHIPIGSGMYSSSFYICGDSALRPNDLVQRRAGNTLARLHGAYRRVRWNRWLGSIQQSPLNLDYCPCGFVQTTSFVMLGMTTSSEMPRKPMLASWGARVAALKEIPSTLYDR